jgi:parallel beta-helix repeat protein
MKSTTVAALLGLILSASGYSATIVVPDDHATIQGAIDAAQAGDTVRVRAGLYAENINLRGKAIMVTSISGPKNTTIDGAQAGSVVTFDSAEDSSTVLRGFTITNGSGTVGIRLLGGGIYCTSSPKISGNVITGNTLAGAGYGGGICCIGSPVIVDNIITGNEVFCEFGSGGGGIWCETGAPHILRNTISGNITRTGGNGGGVYCSDSDAVIESCLITENIGDDGGGGIGTYECSPEIKGNTISDNEARRSGGGGIKLEYPSIPIVTDNVITGNVGGGIVSTSASPLIADNVVTGNISDGTGGIVAGRDSIVRDNLVAWNAGDERGGGIYCRGNARVENNYVFGNTSNGNGGGIKCTDSTRLSGNRVSHNSAAWYGGGISVEYPGPTLSDCEVTHNTTGYYGGGIYFLQGQATASNCIVAFNSAVLRGGGIYCREADPDLINLTLFDNRAGEMGGGICCSSLSEPIVSNSIIRGGTAPTGPEIFEEGGPHATFTHCNIEGGWQGTGIIDKDPGFYDHADCDFHLNIFSPCIDAGTGQVTGLPSADFEGDSRSAGGAVDIGADEFYLHLYHSGSFAPGERLNFRVVGYPRNRATLVLGQGVAVPPYPTQFGDFHLSGTLWKVDMGPIPLNGILDFKATVPVAWRPWKVYPFQAFVGDLQKPNSMLTNLLALSYKTTEIPVDLFSIPGPGGETCWMHRKEASFYGDPINGVRTVFGSAVHPGLCPGNGTPCMVYIWDDPTNDGNPNDCVLVASEPGVVANVDTGLYTTVGFPAPVTVKGHYYVGCSLQHTVEQRVAPIDFFSPYLWGDAFYCGSEYTTPFDPVNLTNNKTPPTDAGRYWKLDAEL